MALSAQERAFIERFGDITHADGLSRIAGQIWGLLLVLDREVKTSEIVEFLGVSRGSVSTNTRLLENFEVLTRRSALGERQDLFAVRREPARPFLLSMARRAERNADFLSDSARELEGGRGAKNIAQLSAFFSLQHRHAMSMLDEIQDEQAGAPPASPNNGDIGHDR